MNGSPEQSVSLDLNNPIFQHQLLNLQKQHQREVLATLHKLLDMTWVQIYTDKGLKWEVIISRKGPHGGKIYSFRIGKGFRGIAYREKSWMRILSFHPDHDSAYD